MKRFLIETSVENASGTQTWFVDAETEDEALEKHKSGSSNQYSSDVEVTSLGEPEISSEVPLDDFGDSADFCAAATTQAEPIQEPVYGDVLPPIGSKVYIRHGRDDDAHACIVTGYYAWDDHGGDKRLHRVFVRFVYEGTNCQNSRMLCDTWPTAEAALATLPAHPKPIAQILLAEADRRAGAAERELATCRRDLERISRVRDKMKDEWGVSHNVSFDVVWAEALKLKHQATKKPAGQHDLCPARSAQIEMPDDTGKLANDHPASQPIDELDSMRLLHRAAVELSRQRGALADDLLDLLNDSEQTRQEFQNLLVEVIEAKDVMSLAGIEMDDFSVMFKRFARMLATPPAAQEPDVIMHPQNGTWSVINPPPKNVEDVSLYYSQQAPKDNTPAQSNEAQRLDAATTVRSMAFSGVLPPQFEEVAEWIAAGQPQALAELRMRLEAGALQAAAKQNPGLSDAATRWLADGERGISSNTIFTHLTGIDALQGSTKSLPWDFADVRRCRLLLEQVPELMPIFPKMAEVSDAWGNLVAKWDAICQSMDKETPSWRDHRDEWGPITNQLIRDAIRSRPTGD